MLEGRSLAWSIGRARKDRKISTHRKRADGVDGRFVRLIETHLDGYLGMNVVEEGSSWRETCKSVEEEIPPTDRTLC